MSLLKCHFAVKEIIKIVFTSCVKTCKSRNVRTPYNLPYNLQENTYRTSRKLSSISKAGLEVNVNVTIISRADLDVHACLLSDMFGEYMWTA